MLDTNPVLIQEFDADGHSPLILIHDGGGTTFQYQLLESLDRNVYGIANPYFQSGKPWRSIRQMAVKYAAMIKTLVGTDDIIIGGWSLGGILSLEIAHVITAHLGLRVLGIIMIDSIYPKNIDVDSEAVLMTRQITFNINTPENRRQKVLKCFQNSCDMLKSWNPPSFGKVDGGRPCFSGSNLSDSRPELPPTILLRARDPVPIPQELFSRKKHLIDYHRGSRTLGWEEYDKNLIMNVMDVDGHHYSLFDWESLPKISDIIRVACNILDE